MSVEHPTDKQAAFMMRHLSPEDRDRMIADADNVVDARPWFAGGYPAYRDGVMTIEHVFWSDGDIPA